MGPQPDKLISFPFTRCRVGSPRELIVKGSGLPLAAYSPLPKLKASNSLPLLVIYMWLTNMLKKGFFLFLFFFMTLIYPALAQDNGSEWQLQCDLFPYASSLKIACLGEDLHFVWNQNDKLYHRFLGEGKAWSEPEVISVRAGGSIDLVSDGRGLHVLWLQSGNFGYKYFNGQSWSPEERLLKSPESAGPAKMVLAHNQPIAFWSSYKFGTLPHSPGTHPLMFSRRESLGWSDPQPVPCVTNIKQSFAVTPREDGKVDIVWVKNHMGYVGSQLGLQIGKPGLTVDAVTFDPQTGSCDQPRKLAGLKQDSSGCLRSASGRGGALHVLWVDGYSTSRLEWTSRIEGRWSSVREIRSAHGGTMEADLATDVHGHVVIFTYSSKKSSRLSVILNAGTPEETVYHSPKNIGMWLQGVKIALSPLGVLHVVSDSGDYCRFQRVSQ
jgi:hypothetical protein